MMMAFGFTPGGGDDATVTPLPQPKQILRVVLKNGFWFDLDVPKDFVMGVFITSIRVNGYLLNEKLYIKHDEIQGCFIYDSDRKPDDKGAVVQFTQPPKPA